MQENELYRSFYERGKLRNTTHISVANFVFYYIANICGTVYVNACNVNCSRPSLFHSSYLNHRSFFLTLLLTPFYFFAGFIVVLRDPHDLSSLPPPTGENEKVATLTETDCFWNNLVYWFLGYFIGLNYTHFNQGFLKDLSYSPEKMRAWGPKLWCVGIAVLADYLWNVYFAAYCFISIGQGWFQLKVCAVILLTPVLISFVLRKTHDFHFHHYTGAMMALPLLWFPHGYLVFNMGFAAGCLVEGTTRWGYDAWWIRKKNLNKESKPR